MVAKVYQGKPAPSVLVTETFTATDESECPLTSPTRSRSKLEGTVPSLLSYDEIPEWYQDNEYIRNGYRPESNSAFACLASWFYLHNESVNIFSHLIPAIFFLLAEAWMLHYLQTKYPNASRGDLFMFAFFLLTAAVCLGMSSAYHTFTNHSNEVSHFWLRLDFVGIIVLTLGDFASGIYLVFYCEPTLQKIYWAMILSLSLATIVILVNPRFQGHRWRTFRVCTFVVTGLSGFAPLAHGISKFGLAQMEKQSGIWYYLGEGGVLILGVLFYTARIPESFSPGRFDILGCSHQIFHFLVVLATVIHLVGILAAFEYNYTSRACGSA